MKCSVFLAVAAAQAADATLFRGGGDSNGSFGPHGLCSDSYPTLDLSDAYEPLHKPPQIWPDKNGVTRYQMVYNLAHYKGPSYDTILRVHDGIAPGPTIHVVPGGKFVLELVNCLRPPLGFHGPESDNRYHLPNSTNMHTHGPHVSGKSPGDNVFINLGPGESTKYVYEFNENHMPGTFWYHPHLHGSTALQVGQGAAGMIIMDEPKDYDIPDAIKDMPEIQMVFQHMALDILRESSEISQDGITNWVDHNFEITNKTTDLTNFMLVNMQFLPKVTMKVGKWYRWRMALSSIRESISFLSQSENCEFQLIAKDGIFLNDAPRAVPAVILSPGNRADVAVRCSEVGLEYMNATDLDLRCSPNYGCFDPSVQPAQAQEDEEPDFPAVPQLVGTFHAPELQPVIMVIDVVTDDTSSDTPAEDVTSTEDSDLEPFTVPRPCYLVDLQDLDAETEIDGHFTNEFNCVSPGETNVWPNVISPEDTCGVNGPYGVGGIGGEVIFWQNSSVYINDFAVGSVQEIDLLFTSFHPYHQHINPFQIVEFFNFVADFIPGWLDPVPTVESYLTEAVSIWYQVGDWQDTLQLPTFAAPFPPFPFSASKIRFQADLYGGHMVQHCHLLFHEDQGMVAQYDITGKEGDTWAGAREIDGECIKPKMGGKPNRE